MTAITQGALPTNVMIKAVLLGGYKWDFGGGAHSLQYIFANDGGNGWFGTEKSSLALAMSSWSNVANIQFAETATRASADFVFDVITSAQMSFYNSTAVDPVIARSAGYFDLLDFGPTNSTSFSDLDATHTAPLLDNQLLGLFNYQATPSQWTVSGTGTGSYHQNDFVLGLGLGLGLSNPSFVAEGSPAFPGVTPGDPTDLGDNSLNHMFSAATSYNRNYTFDGTGHAIAASGPILTVSGSPVYNYGYTSGPMAFDIAAIQYLYGANTTYHNGANSYVLPDNDVTGSTWICIYDTGGTDEIRYDGLHNAYIDLRAATLDNTATGGGVLSQVAFYHGGFTIANGVVIENAVGGSANDTFRGNSANNTITGNGGTDTFIFSGMVDQYVFTETANYVVTGNSEGTDTLNSIEKLQFSGGTITDDYRGTTTGAPTLATGGSITGSIQFHGDRDWFKTNMVAGHWYTITETGSNGGGGTIPDTYLRLYDTAGTTELAHNDDRGQSLSSKLIIGFNTTADRYISAGAYNDFTTGSPLGTYTVSVEQTSYHNKGSWTGAGAGSQGWYTADFNGDGKTDVMRYVDGLGSQVLLSTGTAFAAPVTWTGAGNGGHWYVGDFNGDGKADIFRYLPGVSGAQVQLSTGTGLGALTSWCGAGSGDQGWYVGDFNGDGKDDIMRYHSGFSGAEVLLSNGSGSFGSLSGWTNAGNGGKWYVGDFNGDGKDDIMRFVGGNVQVLTSNGTSFGSLTTWLAADGAGAGTDGWYVSDFDGDGKADLMRYVPGVSGAQVFISTGTGFVDAGSWAGAGHGDDHWYLGHFTGDNSTDLLRIVSGVTGGQVLQV